MGRTEPRNSICRDWKLGTSSSPLRSSLVSPSLSLLRNCKTPWRRIKVNRTRSRIPIHPLPLSLSVPHSSLSPLAHARGSFSHAKFPICRDLDAPTQTLTSLPPSLPPSSPSLALSRVIPSVSRTTTSYSAFLMIAAGPRTRARAGSGCRPDARERPVLERRRRTWTHGRTRREGGRVGHLRG